MRKATRAQWIKFGIITLLYLIFLVWVKSWWGLVIVPFIFDIYISKKIPWGFWKKSKNPAVRGIMSWVDAIVFALVAVYFVNIYIFQNYQIPSSSLEKSLLVGDFLYVSKMSYGPRVPNTPLSMPLAKGETERYCRVQLSGRRYGSAQQAARRLLQSGLQGGTTCISQ